MEKKPKESAPVQAAPAQETPAQAAKRKDAVLGRLRGKYPDKKFEDEEELFGAIDDDYGELNSKYEGLSKDNMTIGQKFVENPAVAAFFHDVITKGDDPAIAFVRNFGRDILDSTDDEERLKSILDADTDFRGKREAGKKMAQEQEANLTKSEEAFDAFQKEIGIDDTEMGDFVEKICEVTSSILMGVFTPELLKGFWEQFHVEDIAAAANAEGEIKGRNAKIIEKKKKNIIPEGLPPMVSGAGGGGEEKPKNPKLAAFDKISKRTNIWETGKPK